MFNIENLDQTDLTSVHKEIVKSGIIHFLKKQKANLRKDLLNHELLNNEKDFYMVFYVYFLFKINNYIELEYSNFDNEDRASLEFFSRETAPLELISTIYENETNINFLIVDIVMFLNLHNSLITKENFNLRDLFITFLNELDISITNSSENYSENYSTKDLINKFMTYNTDMEMYLYNVNLLQKLYDKNKNKTPYIIDYYLKNIHDSENDFVESSEKEEKQDEDLETELKKILDDFSSNSYETNKDSLKKENNDDDSIDNKFVHKKITDLTQDINENTSSEVKKVNMISSKINKEILRKVNDLLENSNYNTLYLALSTYMNEVLNAE